MYVPGFAVFPSIIRVQKFTDQGVPGSSQRSLQLKGTGRAAPATSAATSWSSWPMYAPVCRSDGQLKHVWL